MMHVMEPLFDVAYLGVVIALGLRLLLESSREAKNYGLMAVVLGLGDAFHLVPRVVSHLTPDGFTRYLAALSYGEMVTSVTMTVFYLLFYRYYRSVSGDRDPKKAIWVTALAAARIVLTLLPQNRWGTEGSYLFSLLRNVPFALMGLLLILWTWKRRDTEGLRYTAVLIAVSFLCYLPVVIGARFLPLLGALMIPKTVAYVLLVAVGYRYFIREFRAAGLLKTGVVLLVLGLAGGVFYREFTRFFGWNGPTALQVLHPHLLVAGFLFCCLTYLLVQREEGWDRRLRTPAAVYLTGLGWTVAALMVRGISTITAGGAALFPEAALAGMAGVGHALLGVGMVWVMLRAVQGKTAPKEENK